jgi:hypothetical protein
VGEMVESLDFERGFSTLLHAMPRLQDLGKWEPILATFQNRHGDLAKGVPDTLAECLRREYITQMRHHIENPDHRFFLALVMNVQNRNDIHSLITKRFPDQSPVETILGWVAELIEPTDFGLTLLDAAFAFPESLDIEAQYNLLIDALKHALEEDSEDSESKTVGAKHPEIHSALSESCLRPLFS